MCRGDEMRRVNEMYRGDEMCRADEMRRADVRRNSGGRVLLLCGFGTSDADEMERTYGKLVEEAREAALDAAREAALDVAREAEFVSGLR